MQQRQNLQVQQISTTQSVTSLQTLHDLEPRLAPLFNRFADIYGHLWTSSIGDHDRLLGRMKEWHGAIHDLSDEQINKAVTKCKFKYEFISIHKFRCEALGIKDASESWSLINKDELATEAYNQVDAWFKKTATEKDVKKEFIANYNNLVDKLLMGEK